MDALVRRLAQLGKRRRYKKSTQLYLQGDSAECVFVLHGGDVRMTHTSSDGTQFSRIVCQPGSVLELASSLRRLTRLYTALALTDVEVTVVLTCEVLRAICDGCVLRSACEVLASEVRELHAELIGHMCLSARSRLIQVLRKLAQREGRGPAGTDVTPAALSMAKQDIAAWIGVTPVHLSRLISAVEKDGLLYRNRQSIVLRRSDGISGHTQRGSDRFAS
jgi:CRP-like cAMP-binding protein